MKKALLVWPTIKGWLASRPRSSSQPMDTNPPRASLIWIAKVDMEKGLAEAALRRCGVWMLQARRNNSSIGIWQGLEKRGGLILV